MSARAGLSTTWYTWLEQGRDIRPSGALLDRLANALVLGDAERAHLIELARPDLASGLEHVRFSGSPALTVVVSDLLTRSDDFARIWNAHAVDFPEIWTKRLSHPNHGVLEFSYASIEPSGVAEDLSVAIYSPASAPNASTTRDNSSALATTRS